MSRTYDGYRSTSDHQKKIGKENEWSVVHILQDYGFYTSRFMTDENRPPMIFVEDHGYLGLPDIWAARDGERYLIEAKRKAPTVHGTFGIPLREIQDTVQLAQASGAIPLFVVHDTDTNRKLCIELTADPESMGEGVCVSTPPGKPTYVYVPRSAFWDFVAFLEWDRADAALAQIHAEQDRRDKRRDADTLLDLELPHPLDSLDPDLRDRAAPLIATCREWHDRMDA